MSSPFTYQIDERNVRMQLKDLEYPLPENAWNKFESYASSKVVPKAPGGLASLRLNLNRNVIVPVVFGVVVVSFSIMLVNFISIKPASKQAERQLKPLPVTTSVETASSPVVVSTQEKRLQEKQKEPAPQQLSQENLSLPELSHSSMPGEKTRIPGSQPATELSVVQNSAADSGEQAPATLVNTELKADTETVVKKKRRKNVDPATQVQEEIRPTVVSDNQEEDVRPN